MRVLIISPFSPPADGIGEHTRHLVGCWASRDEVLVVAPGHQTPLLSTARVEFGGAVRVLRALSWRPRQLRSLVDHWKPDVVVCQFAVSALTSGTFSALALCAHAKASGIAVTMACHEPVREIPRLGPFGPVLYRYAARCATRVVAYSSIGQQALKDISVTAEVVAHGTPVLAPLPKASASLEPVILALGFVHPDKGTDTLLDAALHLDPSARVKIAGTPRARRGVFRYFGRADAAFADELSKRAGRNSRVSMLGFVPDDDLAALLASAAVVVLPYRNATQSGIASLATAAHVPAVASDLPGLREQLGAGALYVPPGNPIALARAINKVITDGETADALRSAAVAKAAETTYEKVADELVKVDRHEPRHPADQVSP